MMPLTPTKRLHLDRYSRLPGSVTFSYTLNLPQYFLFLIHVFFSLIFIYLFINLIDFISIIIQN